MGEVVIVMLCVVSQSVATRLVVDGAFVRQSGFVPDGWRGRKEGTKGEEKRKKKRKRKRKKGWCKATSRSGKL
jgi:hypothetical protein